MIGTTWQVIANTIGAENRVQVNTVMPKEGSTGWSDTWDGFGEGGPSQLCVQVDGLISSPEVNAQVAEYFGEALPIRRRVSPPPKVTSAILPRHRRGLRLTDPHSTTPQKECVDGSGDNCTAYNEWVDKWQQIKG